MTTTAHHEEFPGLLSRVKALITDSIIIIVFMATISVIFTNIKEVPDVARVTTFIIIFFLYDPLFTSILGGTLGHRINGIRVKRVSDMNRNIPFYLAILRFIFKSMLGWISLLTIPNNNKGKAIHDLLVGSVVVYNKNTKANII